MPTPEEFKNEINKGYTFSGPAIVLGTAILNGQPIPNCQVKAPLKTMNRHGLIAGATGTGKTKSIQLFSEQLAQNGVNVLMMDIKGDFSGIAAAGTSNPKIEERAKSIGITWKAQAFPVEIMTISTQDGVRLRATVSEFGPILISKILGLNDTQEGVIATIFKFADDNALPLVDVNDLKKVLQFAANEGKEAIQKDYGMISPSTIGTIQRKLVELQSQGADLFFGERSFDVNDLLRKDENGFGYINVVRLTDIQDKPKLFSTFMLSLLAEVYSKFPERGDQDQPELVIFIDEAHLVFEEATKALLDQLEAIVKLVRSKGVGLFFCTQNPNDIPPDVLAQLGMKIQHALRAFTAKDRQAIKLVAENYPTTTNYKVDEVITQMGIGEAFVTVLNEKGIPTPLAHTLMAPPSSRMDILNDAELTALIGKSQLYKKYREAVDTESAYEILAKRIEQLQQREAEAAAEKKAARTTSKTSTRQQKSTLEKMLTNTTTRQIARTATREVTRGLLGALKGMFK